MRLRVCQSMPGLVVSDAGGQIVAAASPRGQSREAAEAAARRIAAAWNATHGFSVEFLEAMADGVLLERFKALQSLAKICPELGVSLHACLADTEDAIANHVKAFGDTHQSDRLDSLKLKALKAREALAMYEQTKEKN